MNDTYVRLTMQTYFIQCGGVLWNFHMLLLQCFAKQYKVVIHGRVSYIKIIDEINDVKDYDMITRVEIVMHSRRMRIEI